MLAIISDQSKQAVKARVAPTLHYEGQYIHTVHTYVYTYWHTDLLRTCYRVPSININMFTKELTQ